MNKRFLLPAAAALLAAAPAAAQRPIVPGEVTRGTLNTSDPRQSNGTYYDDYVFAGRRGETVIVNLESGSFDAYLYLGVVNRGTFQEIRRDDDGGNGTNARLEVQLPQDGTFVIRASSLSSATGPYTLTLNGGRATSDAGWYESPPAQPYPGDTGTGYDARGGRLAPGRVNGRLTSSDPTLDNGAAFHVYTYAGRRGERITLTLRSTEFDSQLVLGRAGGRHGVGTVLTRDDDGAGGRDARIVYTFPSDGEYVVRVNPFMPATGAYVLDVESSLGGYSQRPGYNDPGYDQPYVQDELDERLVGRWGLTYPGVRVDPDNWRNVSANAAMGILTIDEDGAYAWRKNGRLLRGQLVPFTPRRDARPGVAYYLINDGRDEFYLFFTEYRGRRFMQVNGRGTDAAVAHGYREGGSW